MTLIAVVLLSCSDGTSPESDDNDSVQEPAGLSITVEAPERAVLGDMVQFDIRVSVDSVILDVPNPESPSLEHIVDTMETAYVCVSLWQEFPTDSSRTPLLEFHSDTSKIIQSIQQGDQIDFTVKARALNPGYCRVKARTHFLDSTWEWPDYSPNKNLNDGYIYIWSEWTGVDIL